MNAYIYIINSVQTAQSILSDFITPKEEKTLPSFELSELSKHVDILLINAENSIKIRQIRIVKKFLSQKPFELLNQYIIIPHAELMTIPSQNALLKSLEELGTHKHIILFVKNLNLMLKTIQSRCQIVTADNIGNKLDEEISKNMSDLFQTLIKSSAGKKIKLLTDYGHSKDNALRFSLDMLSWLQTNWLSTPNKNKTQQYQLIKTMLKCHQALSHNCNPQLCLNNWALGLKK